MINVGIVGGTGYTGVELLRLLAFHPQASVKLITSRKEAGMNVADMFQSLRGLGRLRELRYCDPADADLKACEVVFFATPHGVAMAQARELLAAAAYGLPEMHRRAVAAARIVGNPGCYPTAVQLGFLPLVEAGIVDTRYLIADAKSGVSGAGRKAEVGLLLSEASDNFKAYNVGAHRHHPEIVEGLAAVAKRPVNVVFTPHLTPMIRGIHATLYATLTDTSVDLQALFEKRYAHEPFVDVMPAGSHPETRSVRASNVCRIAVHRPQGGEIAIVLSVIDNLVKGAAGQAVQNMNLMFGLPETSGLAAPP